MNILIDIGHPAHVHLFKYFAHDMAAKRHQVHFTCRNREFVLELLEQEGLPYTSFGSNFRRPLGKIWGLFLFTAKMFGVCRKFRPDILLSHSSMYAAFAAFFIRKPHISFEDTFNFEQVRLYKPFTAAILTGAYDHPLKSKKVVRYPGYHELAYLHPKRFTPDPSVLHELFLQSPQPQNAPSKPASASPSEARVCEGGTTEAASPPFIIIRFVSWSASHDIGHKGISLENKVKAVKEFSKYARVFISSESPLPEDLQPYRFPLPPHRMHDAIAFATFIIGESFTMLSEAAVLGTPAILIHDTYCYYLREQQEKYGLVFNYTESEQDQERAIAKGLELLTTPGIKEQWQQKRARMLEEKIDVTGWLVDFVEEFYKKRRSG